MYEDEYYYEARKKENAKLDAELAGTFATVIGGLIGAVLSCLLFLLRRFDVLSSGLASLLFYMLTYTREWHVAVYITVAFVIFIASMILQHAFLAGRIIFTIFVKEISRNGKEVEAESVAYVVCQHYGINTSDYSFSYVAGWSEGKETPELKASLDKIRQTASEFIYQIDQKMEVLMADKDQVQESAKAPSPFAQELMDKITEGAKDLGFIPVVPEIQEKTANPELKVVVDKALKDLDKKRTLSKVKESVKSKLKSNTEKAEKAPKKSRTSKAKEERA